MLLSSEIAFLSNYLALACNLYPTHPLIANIVQIIRQALNYVIRQDLTTLLDAT